MRSERKKGSDGTETTVSSRMSDPHPHPHVVLLAFDAGTIQIPGYVLMSPGKKRMLIGRITLELRPFVEMAFYFKQSRYSGT